MPFISRLKKLGLLPVPALSTTLTVYSIPLDYSEETNLVYTSDSAIPADATPPADLRFDHPEGHTSPGDVLIWASRVQKKACYVHACWVFDGLRWTKPASASEIMMDHPVHSDYQLVILSGPYVKWELKPDPDREPSLTVPDPPPLRPGARGSINTIAQSVPQNSKRQQRPRSNELASDTPDGSAVLCSSSSLSSRFSTPLSDVPEDIKPNISDSAPGPSSVSVSAPKSRARDDARPRSLTTPPVSGAPPTPNSSRRATTNVPRRRRKRQRGDEDAFVPSSRRSSSSIPPAKRRRLSRERKGSSASDVRVTRGVSERAVVWEGKTSRSEAPMSSFDMSMSGSPYLRSPRLPTILKRPQNEEGAEGVEAGFDPDADAEGETENENDLDAGGGNVDKACDDRDALWSQIRALEREKDALAVHVERMARQYPDIAVRDHATQTEMDTIRADRSHATNGSCAEDANSQVYELVSLRDISGPPKCLVASHQHISTPQPRTHTATQTDPESLPSHHHTHSSADAARTSGAGFAVPIQPPDAIHEELVAARSELAAARIEACAAREALVKDCRSHAHAQTQTSTPTQAPPTTRSLQSAAMQTDAAPSQDVLAAARAEVSTSKRAVNDITAARAADVRHFQGQQAQLVARNKQLEERNTQLELKLAADPLRRPSETEMQASRRAASFETSLRVAQEALQRQRAQAQSKEALQARTITQLARELQEKDVRVRELTKMEGVDKAVGVHVNALEEEQKERVREDRRREKEREVEVLRAEVKMRDEALAGERGFVVRAKQEMERIKEATRSDRMMIGALRDELTRSQTDLSEKIQASAEQLRVQEMRVAQLQQENDTCNAALAAESRTRIDLLSQLQSDAEKHATALAAEDRARAELESQLRAIAEEHAAELKRLQAEITAANNRAKESDATIVKLTQEHRIYTTSRTYLESQLRASHIAYEEHVQKFRAAQQSHEVHVATMAEAHTAALAALTETLDRERAENAALAEKHQTELANVTQSCFKLEKEREHLEQECKARAGLHQELEAMRAELEETKQRSRQLEAQLSSANARVEEERRVVQGEVTALREEYKKVEEALRTGLEREKGRAAEAQKTSTAELCAARDRSSSLEALLATAKQERVKAEDLLAVEISTSSGNKAILEGVRTELEKAHQELKSSQAELSTCKAAFFESEQRQKALHDATNKELEESRTECAHLAEDVAGFADARAKLTKLTEEASQKDQGALELQARIQELSACKAVFTESEKHQKAAHNLTSKELEESRAECTRLSNELTAVRLATGDTEASRTECARLKEELVSLRTSTGDVAALQAKCVRLTDELAAASTAPSELAALQTKCERLQDELTAARASTDDLDASRTECARLAEELAAEQAASLLDPDDLRSRLAAAEAALARENATASEESSGYWAELGSQLLRSLHEVQDQLKVEQVARQRLQDELAAERLRGKTFGVGSVGPLHNGV